MWVLSLVITNKTRANKYLDSNIRLSIHELSEDYRDNPALAELSDGSGIYGSVAVFHSVHCIKRLRYLFYADHYHGNATEREMFELKRYGGECRVLLSLNKNHN